MFRELEATMEPGYSFIQSLESCPPTSTSDARLTNPTDLIARHSSDPDPISPACMSNQRSRQSSNSPSNTQQVLATVSVNRHVWGFYCYSIASEVRPILDPEIILTLLINKKNRSLTLAILLALARYTLSFRPLFFYVSMRCQKNG